MDHGLAEKVHGLHLGGGVAEVKAGDDSPAPFAAQQRLRVLPAVAQRSFHIAYGQKRFRPPSHDDGFGGKGPENIDDHRETTGFFCAFYQL